MGMFSDLLFPNGEFDPGASWRYGMSTAEKARRTGAGSVPGQPSIDENDPGSAEKADRYSAGYYFARNHPTASKFLQPLVDRLHTSVDMPGNVFLDPYSQDQANSQSFATMGHNKALIDLENEKQADRSRGLPEDSFFHRLLTSFGKDQRY